MQWSESIEVRRPLSEVRHAVVDATELLQWSAWPEATGYSCRTEGPDQGVGSTIVFTDSSGVVQGRQTLEAADDRSVDFRLRNRGPLGREMTPRVRFRLADLGDAGTRVCLDFSASAPFPPGLRQLIEAVMARWVRRLHVKDLVQLKAYVEGKNNPDANGTGLSAAT